MYPIREIISDYIDDEGFIHFDAYFTDDEDEQCVVLAIMHQDNQGVYYLDPRYSQDTKLVQAIEDAKVAYKKSSKLYQLVNYQDKELGLILVKNADEQTKYRLEEISMYCYLRYINDAFSIKVCQKMKEDYNYECEELFIEDIYISE